jgi:hypothetical protein
MPFFMPLVRGQLQSVSSYSKTIISHQVQGVTTVGANFEERSKHFWFVPFHVEENYICQTVDGLTLFST